MFGVQHVGGGGTMSWQPGSTRVYSQPSNQGFPGTRQSTQLLAADREGGSVAGYWQTLFESASEETFIYLKMLSPFPPARFVDWYVHCWTDSLSSEKYFGVIQATITSIKVSGYVLPIQWKQAASPQNRGLGLGLGLQNYCNRELAYVLSQHLWHVSETIPSTTIS